jgi:hypothetical protein
MKPTYCMVRLARSPNECERSTEPTFKSEPAEAMTRIPSLLANCMTSEPTAPAPLDTNAVSPYPMVSVVAQYYV